ncbi:MAG: TlpA disulfide reductase family protein [Acidobacteriota bacterium]
MKYPSFKKIIYFLSVIFIILNINLLIKNKELRNNIKKYSILYNVIIISHDIFNSFSIDISTIEFLGTSFPKDTLEENSNSSNSKFLFVIFFTLKDCPACLEEASVWEKIHRKYKFIKVIGISHTDNMEELKLFKQEFKIDFPIIKKPDLFKQFKIRRSPLKFFIDPKGVILFIDGPHSIQEDQVKLIKLMEKLVQIYS